MITGLFLFTARRRGSCAGPASSFTPPHSEKHSQQCRNSRRAPYRTAKYPKRHRDHRILSFTASLFAVFSFMGLTYFSFFNILVMGLFPPSRRFASLASGGFPFYKGKLRRPASPETGSYCPSQDPAAQPPMHLLRSSHLCAFSSFLLNNFQTLGQVLFIGHAVGYT